MALLEAHGLVKFYGSRCVVDGVDFHVDAGEVVGLLGPNGAGKTTSFKMTMGFVAPNGGKVLFNGHELTTEAMYVRARQGMGYLPQETSVFRKLTVEQNIIAILEMVPKLRSLGRRPNHGERWQLTEKMLDQFGLKHVRKNTAGRLSGGEKRRLEIARCLVCEPLLILMDEPFTGIDPKTIADIQQIVIALRKSGIGILLTDHNVREALKITTRSYLIKSGKVCTQGTPYQIIHDPIAINEYLGAGFNDDSFARNPDEQPKPAAEEIRLTPVPAPAAISEKAEPAVEAASKPAPRPQTEPERTQPTPAQPKAAPQPKTTPQTRSKPQSLPHRDDDELLEQPARAAPPEPKTPPQSKSPSPQQPVQPKTTPQPKTAPPAQVRPQAADEAKKPQPQPQPKQPAASPPVPPAPTRTPAQKGESESAEKAPSPPRVVPSTRETPAPRPRDEAAEKLVEKLKSTGADQAAAALLQMGNAAVPALLSALERRDVELRRQVVLVLQRILQRPVVFDPFAQEAVRMQQLAALREHVDRRAG